jgi:hypothetical protein
LILAFRGKNGFNTGVLFKDASTSKLSEFYPPSDKLLSAEQSAQVSIIELLKECVLFAKGPDFRSRAWRVTLRKHNWSRETIQETGGTTALWVGKTVGLCITAVAMAIVAVAIVLVFATTLLPLVVLWPVVAACACLAIFGLIALGIARRHSFPVKLPMRGLELLDNATAKDLEMLRTALKPIEDFWDLRDPCNSFSNWNNIGETLGHRFDFSRINYLSSQVAESIFHLLEIMPIDMLLEFFEKDRLGLCLFQHCNDESILLRTLELLKNRLWPVELADLLYRNSRLGIGTDFRNQIANLAIEDSKNGNDELKNALLGLGEYIETPIPFGAICIRRISTLAQS